MDLHLNDVIILCLVLVNIGQYVFWSRQVHGLIDKLMSKSYAEWVQTRQVEKELKSRPVKIMLPDEEEQMEDETLAQLNGMLGPRGL